MSEEGGRHWIEEIYALLVRLGVDPRDWQVNYAIPGLGEPGSDGQVPPAARALLALPETKVALSTDGDDTHLLSEEGWHVERISLGDLRVTSAVLSQIVQASREHTRRASTAAMFKTGSKEEERLLAGLLAANIREPDRNYVIYRDEHREGGRELTVPDFAWPDLKVAFFVDGLYWHVNKDDDAKMKALRKTASDAGARKALKTERASRAERDADNRSQMMMRGWRFLWCTDRDLQTDAGVAKQVERITELLRIVASEKAATRTAPAPAATPMPVDAAALDLLDAAPAEIPAPTPAARPSSVPPWEDEPEPAPAPAVMSAQPDADPVEDLLEEEEEVEVDEDTDLPTTAPTEVTSPPAIPAPAQAVEADDLLEFLD